MEKVKQKLLLLKIKARERYQILPLQTKRLVWVAGATLVILLVLTLIFAVIASVRPKNKEIPAIPTPTPVSFTPLEAEIANPSRYATDAGVLQIEENIRNFDARIAQEEVREEALNPPQLDFEVEF